jgi:hypothetical protein
LPKDYLLASIKINAEVESLSPIPGYLQKFRLSIPSFFPDFHPARERGRKLVTWQKYTPLLCYVGRRKKVFLSFFGLEKFPETS